MAQRPPESTQTSRLFVRLLAVVAGLSVPRRRLLAIVAMALPPLADIFTRPSVSLGFLYVIGVALAVWTVGQGRGLLLALCAVMAGAIGNHYHIAARHLPIGVAGEAWNAFARLLTLLVMAIVADGLRTALALERWRASYDALTGVLNKGAFEQEAALLIARARTRGQVLVLAYIDLDGFKGVNDRHGHSAGDRVLQAFATAAAAAIRANDLFARIGGDEFVALVAVKSDMDGDRMAEMLHARLSTVLRDTGFPVTCSMGALVTLATRLDLQQGALELADTLMYEVKRSGKNALRIAHDARPIAGPLHAAYPPDANEGLDALLKRLDRPAEPTLQQQDRREPVC